MIFLFLFLQTFSGSDIIDDPNIYTVIHFTRQLNKSCVIYTLDTIDGD